MFPASTCSPPYFLTPRRRPAVSRPLREEPPAFLCAIVNPLALTGALSGADDFLDAHHGLVLAMATLAARVLAAPLLEGDDLGGAVLLDDLGNDLGALESIAKLGIATAAQH